MTDELYVAAEVKNGHQKLAREVYERWKGFPIYEKTGSHFLDNFVDRLNPCAIVPLAIMVRLDLDDLSRQLQALQLFDRKLYYAEQKFKLERMEELDYDARKARDDLQRVCREKASLDERLKSLEEQQRRLHKEYDAIFDSNEQKAKELEKAEKKRKKLAKKLEDAQERLDKDEGTRECVICMDAKITMAFTPCGHACVCRACAENFQLMGPCPICRKAVVHYLEIFMS